MKHIYSDYLKATISDEIFFSKVIRSDKSVSTDFNEIIGGSEGADAMKNHNS